MSNGESTVLIFKCICNFIRDLNESFGTQQKSLLLYAHLVEKTGILNEEPIKKHIHCFHEFVKANEKGILDKNFDAFTTFEIHYSDKVFIDLEEIFERADADEKNTIWKHLVTLLAILDPSSHAKKILQEEKEKKTKRGDSTNEESFLTDIIDKVGKNIDPTVSNPTEMMGSIMNSGVFTELVETMNTGLHSGDLDLTKMIGSLQSMMGNLSQIVQQNNVP